MKSGVVYKVDQWITKILSRRGFDESTFPQTKISWISSIAVTFMIFCVTIAYHIVFPQLRILIYYGLTLTLVYMQGIIYPLFMYRPGVWRTFIDQSVVVFITFVCILLLGGIPFSGGLIFVGLAQVFFSLHFREKRATLLIFLIYILTVILAGVLHPWLKVPPEMTSEVNISLFVINMLWISGFMMVFIMNFISLRIKLEHKETDRLRELDEAKTKLYTYITHEFRTPLTIISGMTDLIKKEPDRWLDKGSEKIKTNAEILLNLVNQMLDLSKIEAGAMQINMIRGDINQYIRYIVELYRSVAAAKNIDLSFTAGDQKTIIDYDPEKLSQIISNLLSNALKFTESYGKVVVTSSMTEERNFIIRVSDNGIGIPDTFLPFIFDRFFRVGQAIPGTGLGLALAKELVKLLNGTITAESVYGQGTEMTVILPVTCNALAQEVPDLEEIYERRIPHLVPEDKYESLWQSSAHSREGKPLLLIVEDNSDVVQLLLTYLANDYDVQISSNGQEGLHKAIEWVPDIILSDVMMPVMDGIEMLTRLKNDFRTSHIPVVILTAKVDFSSRLEGLERGADAYIPKPFVREELIVQMKSLIELRKKLQQRYASAKDQFEPGDKNLYFEDAFMQRIREILTANLSDEMFHINTLCREMAMSRTQIYRKFKSLTDKTIAEYFRSLRLHKARELILGSDISVTEAAYRTGFKNVSHFSRVFTLEFGVNPSEIRK